MRNLLFIDHSSVVGGAQLVLKNYLRYLDSSKFKRIVVCSPDQPVLIAYYKKYADLVYLIKFKRLKRFSPFALWDLLIVFLKICYLIRKESVDIIITNTERALYPATLASIILRVKIVWFIRDYCYNKNFLKLLLFRPSRIFCVSRDVQKFYGFPEKLSKVIYVSSDIHIREGAPARKNGIQKRGEFAGKFIIGYVGRLVEWKGIRYLIESVINLGLPNIKCLIVGDTRVLPSDLKIFLKDKRFSFRGFVDNPKPYYSMMDVFIHSSVDKEPFATTLVEAMQCKVPVVATDTGGTSELVKHRKTGLLIKPGSSEAISQAILTIKKDKRLAGFLISNAFKKVMKDHSIEKEVKMIEEDILNL